MIIINKLDKLRKFHQVFLIEEAIWSLKAFIFVFKIQKYIVSVGMYQIQ